jgi:hypothetical protein
LNVAPFEPVIAPVAWKVMPPDTVSGTLGNRAVANGLLSKMLADEAGSSRRQ